MMSPLDQPKISRKKSKKRKAGNLFRYELNSDSGFSCSGYKFEDV